MLCNGKGKYYFCQISSIDVDLGPAYSTPDSARIFTGYSAASQRQAFVNALSKSCFNFSMDGTTDTGNQEDELVVHACTLFQR